LIQCSKGCWRSPWRTIRRTQDRQHAMAGVVLSLVLQEISLGVDGKGLREERRCAGACRK
jgi:hypothetical protein